MKRMLLLISVFACVLALLALTFSVRDIRTAAPENRDFLIGMSQANLVEPWRVTMNYEIQETAAEYEKLRVIYTDAAQDTEKQIDDVKRLMGYGIDLLIISPNDSQALQPVLSEAYAQIPVIVLDRDIRGEDYTLFIGPNNDSIGYQAGLRVGALLGEKGGSVVEILGERDSPPVASRSEGFARALRQFPNVTLGKQLVGNWLQDEAEYRFKEYLITTTNPADVVFAQNDAMAYGAYIATKELYTEKDIRFVGVDGLDGEGSGKDLVNRGILSATYYCPTGGRHAIESAYRILSGESISEKCMIIEPEEILYPGEEGEAVS